jgi:hypothetical protein
MFFKDDPPKDDPKDDPPKDDPPKDDPPKDDSDEKTCPDGAVAMHGKLLVVK